MALELQRQHCDALGQNVKVSGKKNMNRIRALRALTGRGGGKGEGGMWSNSFHPSPGQAPGHGPGWPGLDTAHIVCMVTRCLGSPEQNRVITSHIAFPVSPDPALTSPGTLYVCGHIVLKITLLPTTGLKVCGYIFQPIKLRNLCSNPIRNVAAYLFSNLSM